jgi:DNA-binding response OmpR family regulator
MKVLIADDDKISRKVLHQLLAAEGYEVIEALDGLQALEIFRRQTAPIIGIIDWLMPGLEGGEVCRQVRKMCAAYPHHLILLTVRDSQTDVVAGLQTSKRR